MKKLLIALFLASATLVPTTYADALSREDAFVYLWSTIYRPVYDTYESPYDDVLEQRDSYRILTWAKRRGLLEDEPLFRPDDQVSKQDIALWLLRTRNVDTIDKLTPDRIDIYASAYPSLANFLANNQSVNIEDLEELVASFKLERDTETHEISFYSEKFHGKGTAFGETFDMNALTAAHPSFPHDTIVKVTNTENEKFVLVRINDRGPFVAGRSMDLSLAAFEAITERSSGILTAVTIERLGDVNLYPRDELEDKNPSLKKDLVPEGQVVENIEENTTENSTDNANMSEDTRPACSRFATYYQKRINKRVRFLRGVPHVFPLGDTLTLQANQFFVVRSVTTNGNEQPLQEWIMPQQEVFSFTPTQEGVYQFSIGTGVLDAKEFTMRVQNCS